MITSITFNFLLCGGTPWYSQISNFDKWYFHIPLAYPWGLSLDKNHFTNFLHNLVSCFSASAKSKEMMESNSVDYSTGVDWSTIRSVRFYRTTKKLPYFQNYGNTNGTNIMHTYILPLSQPLCMWRFCTQNISTQNDG